jgi:DNA polymerase-1
MAINTPIQGSAADMIKIAMVNVHNLLRAKDYATRMILQVHDELIFDVPKDELDEVKPLIMELMKNALPDLDVPILVEAGIGKTWREAH